MPHASDRPILVQDLRYSIQKIIFREGVEREVPLRVSIVASEKPGYFYMQVGQAKGVRGILKECGPVERVCYCVTHQPTRELSPTYDHKFEVAGALFVLGDQGYLGPMKLFPAEDVWPELTRKGWYGELPQFFT